MIDLRLGDCLEIVPTLPEGSVDAILTDLPYGTTACSWDTVIPFTDLWRVVKHVLKPRGVFVTTASQPFTSALVMSNVEWFKYEWVWDKVVPSNFQLANYQPMKKHENILVFGNSPAVYTKTKEPLMYKPIMTDADPKNVRPIIDGLSNQNMVRIRSKQIIHKTDKNKRFPTTVLCINKNGGECNPTTRIHPTQKPVALYEYLVLTYTNPGNTVLDMCAGSGTTGVACVKTGRNFIGIEKREDYYAIMERRIQEAQMQLRLELV